MMPYGDMELCQHWLREWLVAWRHQAITWTNVDLSSMRFDDIHLGALSLEDLKKPINKTRLKIAVLKWHPGLPGVNELMVHNDAYLVPSHDINTETDILYFDDISVLDCTVNVTTCIAANHEKIQTTTDLSLNKSNQNSMQ